MSNPQVSVDPRLHFLMDAHFVSIYKADLFVKNVAGRVAIDTYLQVAKDIESMVGKEFGKGPLEFMETRSGHNSDQKLKTGQNEYELPLIFENEALVYVKAQAVNVRSDLDNKIDTRILATL